MPAPANGASRRAPTVALARLKRQVDGAGFVCRLGHHAVIMKQAFSSGAAGKPRQVGGHHVGIQNSPWPRPTSLDARSTKILLGYVRQPTRIDGQGRGSESKSSGWP